MEKIFEIASHISTPLALARLLATAFFFIARQIISRNIFPKLTAHLSSEIIKLIVNGDLRSLSYTIQYVKDVRNTKSISKVEFRDQAVIFDGAKTLLEKVE